MKIILTIPKLYRNGALTSLTGLDNLESIGGNIDIFGNDALIDLEGLGNLTSVDGGLDISENTSLTVLNLDKLCSVNTMFRIDNNYELCNSLALDLINQIGTCPGGGFGFDDTDSENVVVDGNKDCLAP